MKEPSKPAAHANQKKDLKGGVQSDAALSTTNAFSCDSIHDLNGSSPPSDKVYMDTDCERRLGIITDIQVRASPRTKTHIMIGKVDLEAEANLMPICHFRALFPELCHHGQPKEGVLQASSSRFKSYSRDNGHCHRPDSHPCQKHLHRGVP